MDYWWTLVSFHCPRCGAVVEPPGEVSEECLQEEDPDAIRRCAIIGHYLVEHTAYGELAQSLHDLESFEVWAWKIAKYVGRRLVEEYALALGRCQGGECDDELIDGLREEILRRLEERLLPVAYRRALADGALSHTGQAPVSRPE